MKQDNLCRKWKFINGKSIHDAEGFFHRAVHREKKEANLDFSYDGERSTKFITNYYAYIKSCTRCRVIQNRADLQMNLCMTIEIEKCFLFMFNEANLRRSFVRGQAQIEKSTIKTLEILYEMNYTTETPTNWRRNNEEIVRVRWSFVFQWKKFHLNRFNGQWNVLRTKIESNSIIWIYLASLLKLW